MIFRITFWLINCSALNVWCHKMTNDVAHLSRNCGSSKTLPNKKLLPRGVFRKQLSANWTGKTSPVESLALFVRLSNFAWSVISQCQAAQFYVPLTPPSITLTGLKCCILRCAIRRPLPLKVSPSIVRFLFNTFTPQMEINNSSRRKQTHTFLFSRFLLAMFLQLDSFWFPLTNFFHWSSSNYGSTAVDSLLAGVGGWWDIFQIMSSIFDNLLAWSYSRSRTTFTTFSTHFRAVKIDAALGWNLPSSSRS